MPTSAAPTPTPTPAPFATVNDLFVRLGSPTPVNPSSAYGQALALLDDASHELRAQVGQALDPGRLQWSTQVPVGGRVRLPAVPLRTVHSVVVGTSGTAASFSVTDSHTLQVNAPAGTHITIDFDYGWSQIPHELKRWTLVLAASYITAAEAGTLGLSGGIAGIAVDDGRLTFATNAGEHGQGVTIPESVLAGLRARYATSVELEHQA